VAAVVGMSLLAFTPAMASVGNLGLSGPAASQPVQRVIVSGVNAAAVRANVQSLSATVGSDLDVARAVVADVTDSQLAALEADPNVSVVPDLPVVVTQVAPTAALAPTATPAPAATRSPAAVFPQLTGADQLVSAGITGQGSTVAVLDTGISRLPDFSGRLVGGIDLSGEGSPFKDSFGHGTFVSGLIAGNGASSGGLYKGEAPGARLVSVKVAGASGVTDMATVIAGIDWVVANRARLGISVLNLSLGTIPTTSTVLNPLDQAVEAAWRAGVVVVVSAGNAGPFNGTIMSPGEDPLVITVGALDDHGTASPADDSVSDFSSVGPTMVDGWFKPDLATSGRSVVSLRTPGSTIDTKYPSARVGKANFVGSGTSFSAAITSGAAALVLASGSDPNPDVVKGKLLASTNPAPVGSPFVDGHGSLNVYGAVMSDQMLHQVAPAAATQVGATLSLADTWVPSSWNSANWSTAGSDQVAATAAVPGVSVSVPAVSVSVPALTVPVPALPVAVPIAPVTTPAVTVGTPLVTVNAPLSFGAGSSAPTAGPTPTPTPTGSAWNGSAWNGSAWNGSAWNGSAWNGSAWNGSAWNGSAWNGSAWNGSAWNGSAWNGSAWNGSAWNGSAWNGSAWNGSAWNGSAWN